MTELLDAVLDEDEERVIKLLRAGSDPNEPDEDGMRPLSAGVETGDLGCVQCLLAAGEWELPQE